jgi:decaprenylphospho-beta-D-erythro-pentofuranosid-2-ulose 2-reductase
VRDAFGAPQSLLVVGGSSDIAAATGRALVERGTRRVVLAGRDPEALEAVAVELRSRGCEFADTLPFDAVEPDGHERLVQDAFDRLGDVDAVLVAFGVYGDQARHEADADSARNVVETNLGGAVSVTIPIVSRLRTQGHGLIVAISSVAAERPRYSEYIYAASKAGMDAFYTGLGDRLEGSGVRVLVIRPGFVHSKMNAGRRPTPWAVAPEDVADAVVRGIQRGSRRVWVPGYLRWVMTGVRMLPGSVFRTAEAALNRRQPS